MNNNLIYGKGEIQGLVSIEDKKNGFVEVFTQDAKGKISSKEIAYEYWILTNDFADEFATELEGNGHYKYRNAFTLRDDFEYAKKCLRTKQAQSNAFWINDIKEQFMVTSGETYYKGLKHTDVSVLSFDIETTGLEHNKESKVLLISNTFRDTLGNVTRRLFCYDQYETDKAMFEDWCAWVRSCDPSIVLGHNIFSFDLPYLDFCADKSGTTLDLGRNEAPIRFNSWTSKKRKDATQFYDYTKCYIYGREIVDTFFLALNYDVGRKYDSYGLKSIIEHEELEVKGRQFYDASLIRKNYQISEEWQKIKAYAEHDADDALALWDLMGPATFYWTQKVPKPIQEIVCGATGSQLNSMMVRSYFQEGHSLPKANETQKYEGAISRGAAGLFKNCVKWDIASLYPSIVLQYEIFDRTKDPKGNFYQMVKTLRENRLEHKKLAKETGDKYYSNLEQSEKVGINSAYGFLGSSGLIFNSPANAAKITEYGRDILLKAIAWTKEKNFTLVNCDTDAIMINDHNKELSQERQNELLGELNSLFPEYIKFEPDGYFSDVIILKAKNYILKAPGGKIKKKGSSITDKKREVALREFIDKMIDTMIAGNDVNVRKPEHFSQKELKMRDLYYEYAKEIMDIKDIKRWASKKTITTAVMTSERSNETKVKDAIKGTDYRIADKIYTFFREDETISLVEHFNGDYSKDRLLEKLFKTAYLFESVLDVKMLFKNFALKKNKKMLEHLLAGTL